MILRAAFSLSVLILPFSAFGLTSPVLAQNSPNASDGASADGQSSNGVVDNRQEYARLRDPFKQPNLNVIVEDPKTPLELHPVDQIKMVGVITGPKRLRAMLLTPDGKAHMVSEKMKIGTRNGIVAKVTQNSVLVREKIVNIIGEEENLDIAIQLSPERNNAPGGSQ